MNKPTLGDVLARTRGGEPLVDVLEDLGHTAEEAQRIQAVWTQANRATIDALRRLGDWARSGKPEADWAVVLMPFTFSEEERLAALRRILGRMKGPPIHRGRWNDNRDRMLRGLEDLGIQRVDELAELRGWEAVAEASENVTPRMLREGSEAAVKRFRTALQRLICDDLWGPGWRRGHVQKAVTSDDVILIAEDMAFPGVEASATLAAIAEGAHLTPAESELLEAFLVAGDWPDAARGLGISQGAMRARKMGLVEKLTKAS